jgi:periplasmic protein TonB
MAKEKIKAPAFDDIVFFDRNKEYGAYSLRKRYKGTVIFAMTIGVLILATCIITPYLNARALGISSKKVVEKQVEIKMENLDQPNEVAPPPPPPPPPPSDAVQTQAYVPPVVVDSVKPEEENQFMTADAAQVEVKNEDVLAVVEEVKEEVQEEETEAAPFVVVEEMPMYPGGEIELLKYISEHVVYPEVAKENNIQGRVIIRFCVTSKGSVSQVSVLKGVDPELDAEAIRVVNALPATFKPGKQGGKPVPVWYMVPITFSLK